MTEVSATNVAGCGQTLPAEMRAVKKGRAAALSVVTSAALTAVKFFIGILSGSLALIADALQGFVDVVIGIVTYHAVTSSEKSADAQNTYGREKVEAMAAFFECLLLSAISLFIWIAAFKKMLVGGPQVQVEFWFIAVIAGAICADFGRSVYLRHTARETGSLALSASSYHFLADSLSSAVVLAGLMFVWLGFETADLVATISVAAFLTYSAYKVGSPAVDALLDRSHPALSWAVYGLIADESSVAEVRQLRLRKASHKYFVEAVVALDANLTFAEAAKEKERLARLVEDRLGHAEVIVSAVPDSRCGEAASNPNFSTTVQ